MTSQPQSSADVNGYLDTVDQLVTRSENGASKTRDPGNIARFLGLTSERLAGSEIPQETRGKIESLMERIEKTTLESGHPELSKALNRIEATLEAKRDAIEAVLAPEPEPETPKTTPTTPLEIDDAFLVREDEFATITTLTSTRPLLTITDLRTSDMDVQTKAAVRRLQAAIKRVLVSLPNNADATNEANTAILQRMLDEATTAFKNNLLAGIADTAARNALASELGIELKQGPEPEPEKPKTFDKRLNVLRPFVNTRATAGKPLLRVLNLKPDELEAFGHDELAVAQEACRHALNEITDEALRDPDQLTTVNAQLEHAVESIKKEVEGELLAAIKDEAQKNRVARAFNIELPKEPEPEPEPEKPKTFKERFPKIKTFILRHLVSARPLITIHELDIEKVKGEELDALVEAKEIVETALEGITDEEIKNPDAHAAIESRLAGSLALLKTELENGLLNSIKDAGVQRRLATALGIEITKEPEPEPEKPKSVEEQFEERQSEIRPYVLANAPRGRALLALIDLRDDDVDRQDTAVLADLKIACQAALVTAIPEQGTKDATAINEALKATADNIKESLEEGIIGRMPKGNTRKRLESAFGIAPEAISLDERYEHAASAITPICEVYYREAVVLFMVQGISPAIVTNDADRVELMHLQEEAKKVIAAIDLDDLEKDPDSRADKVRKALQGIQAKIAAALKRMNIVQYFEDKKDATKFVTTMQKHGIEWETPENDVETKRENKYELIDTILRTSAPELSKQLGAVRKLIEKNKAGEESLKIRTHDGQSIWAVRAQTAKNDLAAILDREMDGITLETLQKIAKARLADKEALAAPTIATMTAAIETCKQIINSNKILDHINEQGQAMAETVAEVLGIDMQTAEMRMVANTEQHKQSLIQELEHEDGANNRARATIDLLIAINPDDLKIQEGLKHQPGALAQIRNINSIPEAVEAVIQPGLATLDAQRANVSQKLVDIGHSLKTTLIPHAPELFLGTAYTLSRVSQTAWTADVAERAEELTEELTEMIGELEGPRTFMNVLGRIEARHGLGYNIQNPVLKEIVIMTPHLENEEPSRPILIPTVVNTIMLHACNATLDIADLFRAIEDMSDELRNICISEAPELLTGTPWQPGLPDGNPTNGAADAEMADVIVQSRLEGSLLNQPPKPIFEMDDAEVTTYLKTLQAKKKGGVLNAVLRNNPDDAEHDEAIVRRLLIEYGRQELHDRLFLHTAATLAESGGEFHFQFPNGSDRPDRLGLTDLETHAKVLRDHWIANPLDKSLVEDDMEKLHELDIPPGCFVGISYADETQSRLHNPPKYPLRELSRTELQAYATKREKAWTNKKKEDGETMERYLAMRRRAAESLMGYFGSSVAEIAEMSETAAIEEYRRLCAFSREYYEHTPEHDEISNAASGVYHYLQQIGVSVMPIRREAKKRTSTFPRQPETWKTTAQRDLEDELLNNITSSELGELASGYHTPAGRHSTEKLDQYTQDINRCTHDVMKNLWDLRINQAMPIGTDPKNWPSQPAGFDLFNGLPQDQQDWENELEQELNPHDRALLSVPNNFPSNHFRTNLKQLPNDPHKTMVTVTYRANNQKDKKPAIQQIRAVVNTELIRTMQKHTLVNLLPYAIQNACAAIQPEIGVYLDGNRGGSENPNYLIDHDEKICIESEEGNTETRYDGFSQAYQRAKKAGMAGNIKGIYANNIRKATNEGQRNFPDYANDFVKIKERWLNN